MFEHLATQVAWFSLIARVEVSTTFPLRSLNTDISTENSELDKAHYTFLLQLLVLPSIVNDEHAIAIAIVNCRWRGWLQPIRAIILKSTCPF